MPKKEKGKSHSIRPTGKRPPTWCRYQPEEVEALVVRLAKEGNSPSKIGIILRDQHGIPLLKPIVGKSVTQVLRENGLAAPIPEDLDILLRKAARLHAHLAKHKADGYNRKSLQIVETKITKIAKYYKSRGLIPANWSYG